MSDQTLHFLKQLAQAFEQGRLYALAQHFKYPMPAYVHGGLLVFGAADTFVELLAQYRDIAWAAGVTRLEPRIVAEGLRVRDAALLWVEWDHLDHDGICLRTSQVCYARHYPKDSLSPQIELIDYTVPAFPELAADLPLARSA